MSSDPGAYRDHLSTSKRENSMSYTPKLTKYSDQELRKYIDRHGGFHQAAEVLGCSYETLLYRLKRSEPLSEVKRKRIKNCLDKYPGRTNRQIAHNLRGISSKHVEQYRREIGLDDPSPAVSSKPSDQFKPETDLGTTKAELDENDKTGGATLTTSSPRISTVDEALAYAKVDLDKYKVARHKINFWDVTMGKKKTGTGKPETYTNYQVTVWLEPREEDHVYDSINALINKLPVLKKIPTPDTGPEEALMELCLFDHHFGLLAWKAETGEDYDVRIAQKIFMCAVRQMLAAVRSQGIGRILLPIGNDYMHMNSESGKTPRNKNELDTDCRLAKVFETAEETLIQAVKECAEAAPVDVLWVPGNHDPQTGYYMNRVLYRAFQQTPHVQVDTSPSPRKYYRFGDTLLGYVHGTDLKDRDLPLLMAQERPDFGECQWKEWHVAHVHKRKETQVNVGDTYVGVPVIHLPSLSGTDYWHFQNGFIRNLKTSEANLYSAEGAPMGHIKAVIPKKMYNQD